jgi:hypothetical protein
MKDHQTTSDVEGRKWPKPASHKGDWPIAIVVALGWVCLIWAANLALLAAIQVGMIGLGFIGTGIVLAVHRLGRPS